VVTDPVVVVVEEAATAVAVATATATARGSFPTATEMPRIQAVAAVAAVADIAVADLITGAGFHSLASKAHHLTR
jgi:hypothetical protein